MSTEIKGVRPEGPFETRRSIVFSRGFRKPGHVYVRYVDACSGDGFTNLWVTVEEFKEAVETELDVMIIENSELPTDIETDSDGRITVTHVGGTFEANPKYDTPESLRELAKALLAGANYLEAHPPVDPQVEALSTLLAEDDNWPVQDRHRDKAKALLATGKVTVQTEN